MWQLISPDQKRKKKTNSILKNSQCLGLYVWINDWTSILLSKPKPLLKWTYKRLTSFTIAFLSMPFNWDLFDPFPCDMECIWSEVIWDSWVFLLLTNVFHYSWVTSAGFGCPPSIKVFNLQHVVIKTLVTNGPIHFPLTLIDCLSMSHSASTHPGNPHTCQQLLQKHEFKVQNTTTDHCQS